MYILEIVNLENGANTIKFSSIRMYKGAVDNSIGSIRRDKETIVCLGDSWVAGYMSATLEEKAFPNSTSKSNAFK